MSAILNQIKESVKKGVEVNIQGIVQYGKYPVSVKDITNSVTSGWELTYRIEKSQFNGKAFNKHERFSELKMTSFSNLYTMIQQVYSQFKQGVNVEKRNDGSNFAVYQPNDSLWFTVRDKKNSVAITVTITDDNSPFHMLSVTFVITASNQNGQPYMIGYDSQYDHNTDTYTELLNASMLPNKHAYVPVTRKDNIGTIKAAGVVNNEGLVEIDYDQTEVVYLQKVLNERRLLAGIYEKAILEIVLDKSNEYFTANSQAQQPMNGFNQSSMPHMQNAFHAPQTNQGLNSNPFNPALNLDNTPVF
ncbi:hypothetical protein [Virgibacillus salexigens]|uniref:Uncharacterized protein n=1 Tax=Virgibacillus massiliensis TaxID=1462526 RepID=A0A024QI53_9BACI|nr:hypothetical protein [Virgibacillus massiliensis]CDQ41870.1 hypothetical protein BN990_04249 [Virgibacillus massiliensis]